MEGLVIMDLKENQKGDDKISDAENDTANADKWYRSLFVWIRKTTCVTDWLIFFCTLAIALVSFFQWQTLEKTDQTSRLRDRAFVYFLNPTLNPYPSNKPTVWGIDINVQNAGNMPARRISIRCALVYNQKSEPIIDPFPLAKWSAAQAPNVLGPKQHFSLQGGGIPISAIKEAQKFKKDIFILMEAKYIDGFDLNKSRVTQMSRSLLFDKHGGLSLGLAGPHNCTDDDCPKQ
jgi:hypothetical protein